MFRNYSETVRDIMMITLLTGCRSGEACAINSSEVSEDASGMIWTIPAAKSKNGVAFRTMLPRQAATIIRRRMETHKGWLFPSRDPRKHVDQKITGVEVWSHGCTNERFQNREKCPVSGWSPHDLRRTCRTNLSRLGCPVEVGEAVLNHSPAGVRANYDHHAFDDEKRLWLQRWADYVDSISPMRLRAVA